MKIGIDLNYHCINGLLVRGERTVNTIRKLIHPNDTKKTLMDNILAVIDYLMHQDVKGIGISLPSRIDPGKGVVYDLKLIPHWKGARIRDIIFKKYHKPVYLNSDVNCVILGEKYYGICKHNANVACISLDKNTGTSGLINNQLCVYPRKSFNEVKCLSEFYYTSIKDYSKSYLSTIDELEYFIRSYPMAVEDPMNDIWENIGTTTGRLIAILNNNYNPELFILGGYLSRSYNLVIESISEYLNSFQNSSKYLVNKIVPQSNDNIKALGAATLII